MKHACASVSRVVKPLGVAVTRIARELPMGGDLEYIDAVTLGKHWRAGERSNGADDEERTGSCGICF